MTSWPIGEAVHKEVNLAKVLLDIPGYIRHGKAQITCCCIPLVVLLTCRHMAHLCSPQGDTLANQYLWNSLLFIKGIQLGDQHPVAESLSCYRDALSL